MNPEVTFPPDSVSCEWVRENIASHSIGALDQDESNRLEAHLLVCQECDKLVENWSGTMPLLGLASPKRVPSAQSRANIVASIHAETRQVVSNIADVPGTRPAAPTKPFSRARRAIPTWATSRFAAVPVLALILFLGGMMLNTQQQLGSRRDQVARLERENAAMALQLSSIRAGEAAYGDNANAYQLTSTNQESEGAGGIMLGDPNQSTALLSVWNMPGSETKYHVMCESELGEMLSAGELTVDDRGVGTIQLNLPATVTEYKAVHILAGGSTESGSTENPAKDILQVLLTDPTAVPLSE